MFARDQSPHQMRTVSWDDELVERGANPRTGVVSPFVRIGDIANGRGRGNYLAHSYTPSPLSRAGRHSGSGHWKANGSSWNYVESVPVTSLDGFDGFVMESVGQHFLVETHSEKDIYTDGSMPDRTETLVDQSGGNPLVDGLEAASAIKTVGEIDVEQGTGRPSCEHGNTTPITPIKYNKIRRKAVGSPTNPTKGDGEFRPHLTGLVQKSSICLDNVTVDQHHRESGCARESPLLQGTGSKAVESSRSDNRLSPRETSTTTGIEQKSRCNSQTSPTTNHHVKYRNPRLIELSKDSPFLSASLKDRLPQVQFRHPTSFANVPGSNQRRLPHRIPPSLRSGLEKRQAVEHAALHDHLTVSPPRKQRPKIQRQNGERLISNRFDERSRATSQPLPSEMLRESQNIAAYRPMEGFQQQKVTETMTIKEKANAVVKPAHPPTDQKEDPLETKASSGTPSSPKIRPDVVIPNDLVGVNSIHRNAGQHGRSRPHEDDLQKRVWKDTSITPKGSSDHEISIPPSVRHTVPPNYPVEPKTDKVDSRTHDRAGEARGNALIKSPSVLRRTRELAAIFDYCIDDHDRTPPSRRSNLVRQILKALTSHVISKFAGAVTAIRVLGNPDAPISTYVAAISDIGLASIYFLILLHFVVMAARVLEVVSMVLYYVWHPLETTLFVLRWMIVP